MEDCIDWGEKIVKDGKTFHLSPYAWGDDIRLCHLKRPGGMALPAAFSLLFRRFAGLLALALVILVVTKKKKKEDQ